MLLRNCARRSRRGATLAESAVVFTVLFFLLFGIIVGGLGIFRYQMVATLAREGARYASVHGADFQSETGQMAATRATIFSEAIQPKAFTLNLTASDIQVQLVTPSGAVDWDGSNKAVTTTNAGVTQRNSVRVTVTYQWFPEVSTLLGPVGPITLTSTSTMPMSF